MNRVFEYCSSLLILPEISKWNTNNVVINDNLFKGSSSLLTMPDIYKWNIFNILNKINSSIYDCNILVLYFIFNSLI